MRSTTSLPPDLDSLNTTLSDLLNANGHSFGPVRVVRRIPDIRGTFVKEIVTCRRDDGTELELFCKYEADDNHNAHGHRGGIAREVLTYRNVLKSVDVSAPRLLAVHEDATTGERWLVLEYLKDSLKITKAPDPPAMGLAARWAGHFHAATEEAVREARFAFLDSYDAAYYLGWTRRTLEFAGQIISKYPWLETLAGYFEKEVPALLDGPVSVIHGEYYSQNILFADGRVYPVDWESTAIAAGEIDLACLAEGWSKDAASRFEREYVAARWPSGRPEGFDRRLGLAQLYLHFRWLGDRKEWTRSDHFRFRFERLHATGRQLGVI